MKDVYHIPVMPDQSVEGLGLFAGATVVDATYGGGGHSRLILEKIGNGKLFAFDQDKDAVANIIDDNRLVFIRHNFRYLKNFLRYYNTSQVDAILADLGVSSHDFNVPERGFSFRFDDRLDMRMNPGINTDAAHIINNYSEEELISIFREFGEIKNSNRLVSEIIKYRREKPVLTTGQLKEIALKCSPPNISNKYLAKVFQALRIEVNDEMGALKELLMSSLDLLRPGGRLVVITYHSLEDRLCKYFMKSGNFEGRIEADFFGNRLSPFRLINKKVIVPDQKETSLNKRARSAKLRIAEKI
jgi:16S rRNA (cytosine1402-N4)-methyltransferase